MNIKRPSFSERLGALALLSTIVAWSFFSKNEQDAIIIQTISSPFFIGFITFVVIIILTLFLSWSTKLIRKIIFGAAVLWFLITILGYSGRETQVMDPEIIGIALLLLGTYGLISLITYSKRYIKPIGLK